MLLGNDGGWRLVARQRWGQRCVLRITRGGVITSLLRDGLAVTGSCLPPDLLCRMDTLVDNVAARKISGVDNSTRIEVLHFLALTHSFTNLYIGHCAGPHDLALRASGSSIEARMRRELQAMTGSDLSQITCVQIKPLPAGEETMTRPSVWAATNWYVNRYAQQPDWERVEALAGIYACHASEFNAPHFSDPMSIALWEWRRGPTWQSRCSATSAGHQSAHKRSIWTPRELCPLLQKEAD